MNRIPTHGTTIAILMLLPLALMGCGRIELGPATAPHLTDAPTLPTSTPILLAVTQVWPQVTPAPPTSEPTPSSMPPVPARSIPDDAWTRPADGMVMVYVPQGTFQMGSTSDQIEAVLSLCEQYPDEYGKCKLENFGGESPQHAVTLDAFWIDRTEVTNGQYALCVAQGTCRESRLASDPDYNGDNHPVAGIPWQDAAAFCAWVGGRLPTEAQWEYAARGPENRIYPWGIEFDCEAGNFWDDVTGCDDGYPGPAPVGSFAAGASWCGALDMAGNAWEWVRDSYGSYPAGIQANPVGPDSGEERILRGGSWGYHAPFVRTAFRYPVPPSANYLAVGFRCMLPASPSGAPVLPAATR